MNVATAASFLSDEFETEILLSKNALVFLHGLGQGRRINYADGMSGVLPIASE